MRFTPSGLGFDFRRYQDYLEVSKTCVFLEFLDLDVAEIYRQLCTAWRIFSSANKLNSFFNPSSACLWQASTTPKKHQAWLGQFHNTHTHKRIFVNFLGAIWTSTFVLESHRQTTSWPSPERLRDPLTTRPFNLFYFSPASTVVIVHLATIS